jgi:exonuclease SbcC
VRPTSLFVEGFLSWAEPTTLEFEGLDAAVIVGPNGSGKTALVEAMGWALFGAGRARSPDAFVTVGSTRCRVQFEFDLNGAPYRVRRERDLSTGKSYLGLFVDTNDYDGFGWQPVGGDSIAETQEAICRLLGLSSFDAWAATSFIGQGRVGQFTRKTPAERKALLAEVLDLGIWERIRERAQERARTLAAEAVALQREVERLEDVVPSIVGVRARLSDARKTLSEAERQVASLAKVEEERAGELAETRARAAAIPEKRTRLQELRQQRSARTHRAAEDLERAKADLRRAQAEREEHLLLKDRAVAAAEEASTYEARAAVVEQDRSAVTRAVGGQRETASRCSEGASAARSMASRAEDELAKVRADVSSLHGQTQCRACGQYLSPGARAKRQDQLAETIRLLQDERSRAGAEAERLDQLAEEAIQGAKESEAEDRLLQQEAEENRRLANVARAVADAEQGRLEATAGAVERITEAEERRDHAVQDGELAAGPGREERTLVEEIGAAEALEAEVADQEVRLTALRQSLQEARARAGSLHAEVGAAEQALVHVEEAQRRLETVTAEMGVVSDKRWVAEGVALLAGKDGVPALVLEAIACPAIEAEANAFLSKLTVGEQLSVRLETLSARKAGGEKETLQIVVSDHRGDRPIESLSGAERQCVDLAFHVGLARLLARRANQRIETLVLDEAFTAMDVAHLQATISALQTVRQEFPVLLVITHQEALADAFPQRIEIHREGDVSRLVVVGSPAETIAQEVA